MGKLKSLIDRWKLGYFTETGRPYRPLKKYPPVMFDILWDIYHELKRNGYCTFFQADVKEILEKCGLTVKPFDDVSWVAWA